MAKTAAMKEKIRRLLYRVGLEVKLYKNTVAGRRQRLLEHLGVDLMVDIGANDGRYGVGLRDAGYSGRILSFEPGSETFAKLASCARDDATWGVVKTAVGNSQGTVVLNVSGDSLFSSVLPMSDEVVSAVPEARYVSTEEVPVDTLDALLAGERWRSLAVKVDVQGFEREVLDGGVETMSRASFVQIELSPTPLYPGQMLLREGIERLDDLGLTLVLTDNVFPDPATGRAHSFDAMFVRTDPAEPLS